jgi:putative endonuclease
MMHWFYRLGDAVRHRSRRRRWAPDQASGRHGEDLAHRYLQSQGYVVVARNWRHPSGAGELDIVAWEGETLVFVEVKSRGSEEHGRPEEAVGPGKQEHLDRVARAYARAAGADPHHTRFDIVTVVFADPPRIELLRDAFAVSRTLY